MAKFGRLFLVVLLIFTSVGVTVNKHFCGEMLESIAINKEVDSCCKGAEMPKGCCHDELEAYDLDEHQITSFSFDFKAPEVIAEINYLDIQLFFRALQIDHSDLFHVGDSPPLPESDLLIEIQTFLI